MNDDTRRRLKERDDAGKGGPEDEEPPTVSTAIERKFAAALERGTVGAYEAIVAARAEKDNVLNKVADNTRRGADLLQQIHDKMAIAEPDVDFGAL
jgi:hypothetical protein